VTYGFLYRLRRQRVREPGGMNDRTRATSCSLVCKVRVIRTMSGGRESSLLALELELTKQVTGNHSSKRKAILPITKCYGVIMSVCLSVCISVTYIIVFETNDYTNNDTAIIHETVKSGVFNVG
jgi:hypothetical protein